MSTLRADNIIGRDQQKAPSFPKGINITGVATATTFKGGVEGNVTGNVTGNAGAAAQLQTARTIGGVSFNGTTNINLPGVNQAGNQNTSGTSAGLSGTPNINVGDVTATGNLIAVDGTFSGNVSIAKTLTYEDVKNIDSVGVVTARNGIRVGAGKSIGSDGAAVVYYGDGSQLSGITGTTINNNADNRIITGSGTANTLEGESTCTYSTGTLSITGSASGHGLNLTNPGNHYTEIQMNANRSAAHNLLGQIHGKWNGNSVCDIRLESGEDTTNKDDGRIAFQTRESGQALATAMLIDEKGYVTKPKQPSMQVQRTGGHTTNTMTPIVWDDVRHNVGSCYDQSNGRFTAPVNGKYLFCFSCLSKNGGSGAMVAWARKNGGNEVYIAHSHHVEWGQEGAAIIFNLAANDYMDIKKEKDILFGTYTQWSMTLLN